MKRMKQPARKRKPKVLSEDYSSKDHISVVGIGASAGGLDALEMFFRRIPEKSGFSFVVVQHLDPTHKGMLVELLQQFTPIKVLQIKDRMKVEPNRIYVIPPNKDLSIFRGKLHLFTPAASRGFRLPIDFFFRSLAAEQRHRSIGVILSGMGSDGTLGLRAIKEQGGVIFVQDPLTAKFDSMPRHVIDAGLADIVAPVEALAEKLIAFCAQTARTIHPGYPMGDKTQRAIDKICVLLRDQTGNDFSQYKRSTLSRRIERRMGLHQITDMSKYVQYLRTNPQETENLFKELLIGVTGFFRDASAWEHLGKKVLPGLLSKLPLGAVIRCWVAGCSTGEEAYSLAIVLKEAMAKVRPGKGLSLQVFGTDLDEDSIERARAGSYPLNIVTDVSAERLRRYFKKETNGYRVAREIRETVIFAQQNVIMDPPFTKLDILCCRNLLIYFSSELQKRLLPMFHYALKPGGVLFLGSAETASTVGELFAPMVGKMRFFRRLYRKTRIGVAEFPVRLHHRPHGAPSRGVSVNKPSWEVAKKPQAPSEQPDEELQSANEELQSTNEELTTSKEEMQSLNEELQTLNHELQIKVDVLTRTKDDMKNLLDATDIATLFLDPAMRVRRYTVPMTRIIKLIPTDVGRPLSDLASNLIGSKLEAEARKVLQTLVVKEKTVETVDGRRFAVRILPYRRLDNKVDGVVITFSETGVLNSSGGVSRKG
jgi:two-component system CheB/CheR fusion protein